jgi:hypothetical protein
MRQKKKKRAYICHLVSQYSPICTLLKDLHNSNPQFKQSIL